MLISKWEYSRRLSRILNQYLSRKKRDGYCRLKLATRIRPLLYCSRDSKISLRSMADEFMFPSMAKAVRYLRRVRAMVRKSSFLKRVQRAGTTHCGGP